MNTLKKCLPFIIVLGIFLLNVILYACNFYQTVFRVGEMAFKSSYSGYNSFDLITSKNALAVVMVIFNILVFVSLTAIAILCLLGMLEKLNVCTFEIDVLGVIKLVMLALCVTSLLSFIFLLIFTLTSDNHKIIMTSLIVPIINALGFFAVTYFFPNYEIDEEDNDEIQNEEVDENEEKEKIEKI